MFGRVDFKFPYFRAISIGSVSKPSFRCGLCMFAVDISIVKHQKLFAQLCLPNGYDGTSNPFCRCFFFLDLITCIDAPTYKFSQTLIRFNRKCKRILVYTYNKHLVNYTYNKLLGLQTLQIHKIAITIRDIKKTVKIHQ